MSTATETQKKDVETASAAVTDTVSSPSVVPKSPTDSKKPAATVANKENTAKTPSPKHAAKNQDKTKPDETAAINLAGGDSKNQAGGDSKNQAATTPKNQNANVTPKTSTSSSPTRKKSYPQPQPHQQQQHQQQQRRRGSSKSVSVAPGPMNQSSRAPLYHRHYYPQYQAQNQYPYTNFQQNLLQQQQQRRHHSDTGKQWRRHSTTTPSSAAVGLPSPTSSKKHDAAVRQRTSRSESGQNGEEQDYYPDDDEFELEEPFSDDDEENDVLTTKMKRTVLSLPMPRRRIRTLSGMIPAVGYSPVFGGPTMCLNCFDFYDLPNQTDDYVTHLLDKHRIIVTDIGLIVDLKRYIEYWRHRFGQEAIDKVFPELTPKETDPLHGKVEKYFLMSEKLPEDRKLRERLAMRRLEEVLSCQQREREDHLFARQCLFCRYQAKGNRSKLIHHLYMIHHLNLGSPDNLVFVNEYLDVLQGKLQRGECIYCEKQFSDHPTLMEHMRKKGHREVNPNNNYYDKFYVINYLELGKKWVEVLAEDFEDTMPTFADSEEEEEEETWNEWQEDNIEEEDMNIVCLFCDDSFVEADTVLDHMSEKHSFDLRKVVKEEKMNFYDRVKFINFIRKLSHSCICFVCGKDDLHSWQALRKHLSDCDHLSKAVHLHRDKWDKEEFLIPTYENDSFLCVLDEFDDVPATLNDPAILDNGPVDNSPDSIVVAEDVPDITDTILNDSELREQLK